MLCLLSCLEKPQASVGDEEQGWGSRNSSLKLMSISTPTSSVLSFFRFFAGPHPSTLCSLENRTSARTKAALSPIHTSFPFLQWRTKRGSAVSPAGRDSTVGTLPHSSVQGQDWGTRVFTWSCFKLGYEIRSLYL